MGNLMTTLLDTANALQAYEGAFAVMSNNVDNANTPGYAKQIATFQALPFDVSVGLPGGVQLGPTENTRSAYAEQSVRTQQTAVGADQQKVADLTAVQNYFPVSDSSGLAPSISTLFQDFSQLSVTPNDTVARQTVLNAAATVAQNFNDTANGLLTQQNNIEMQTTSTVDTINQLAGQIAEINSDVEDTSGNIDAGVDAQLNSTLQQLSQYVNFTTLQQSDGTVTVYVGGQTPLVIGNQTYAIQADLSGPQTSVLSSTGADITSTITGGQLSALLDDNNNVIPGYLSSLNTLAQTLADQVNNTLNNGVDQNGAAPTTNLFTYDATTGAAQTLTVNSLTPDQIAAALPGAPGGNGNALALAALQNAPLVNDYTFAEYYGNLGGQVGSDLSNAQNNQTTDQDLLNQAESLRQQISGVNLDEEAENMIEYERSYQALSKMLGTINSVTDTLMNMVGVVTT